jgi:hypothetical protein
MLGHILSGFCRLAPKLIKAVAVGIVNVMTRDLLIVRMKFHVWYFIKRFYIESFRVRGCSAPNCLAPKAIRFFERWHTTHLPKDTVSQLRRLNFKQYHCDSIKSDSLQNVRYRMVVTVN